MSGVSWDHAGGTLVLDHVAVMGIVNVTPDSFSDGGLLYPGQHPEASVAHGLALHAEGAALVDVGGESTRPRAEKVTEAEELRRVVPVVEGLAEQGVLVSIDTTKPAVALAAVRAGAAVVNDVSGGRDRTLLEVAGEVGAGYVLMHTRGDPRTMQSEAHYDDVVTEVYDFLARGLERCEQAGIGRERVVIDPGIGFAKLLAHNLALLRALPRFDDLRRPVMIGASRKSFLGALLDGAGPDARLEGSLAVAALAVAAGARVLRVHEVGPTVRAARVAAAVAGAGA